MRSDDKGQQGELFVLTPTRGEGPEVKVPTRKVWTENKARLIERYLRLFEFITKNGAYIDAFAGPQEPTKPDSWAAKLVLDLEPRWFRKFYLCDKSKPQIAHLEELKKAQPSKPKRDIRVLAGDSNIQIPKLLAARPVRDREAVFCLLDQRTFECDWATLKALAAYKTQGYKIELFYFLANGWFDRAMAAIQSPSGEARVEAWWGRKDWRSLRGLHPHLRAVSFASRFREELGYISAMPRAIYGRERGGRIMYWMIHATDHPKAPEQMARAYDLAVYPRESAKAEQLQLPGLPPLTADEGASGFPGTVDEQGSEPIG